MNRMKLTESDLRSIVAESIRRVLTEGYFQRRLVKDFENASDELDDIRKTHPGISTKDAIHKVSWLKHPLARAAQKGGEINDKLKGRPSYDEDGEPISYSGDRYNDWFNQQASQGDAEWDKKYQDFIDKNEHVSGTHKFVPPSRRDYIKGAKGKFVSRY